MTGIEAAQVSRRDRARARTVAEIKATALELMREHGATDVRFVDIARAMGMTAPALYRYYPDRDALLTALIVDAWNDLAATLLDTGDTADSGDQERGLLAVASAYREWARADPPRFTLIFGLPIPGYALPAGTGTFEAAGRSRVSLERLIRAALARGDARPPAIDDVDPTVAGYLEQLGGGAEPPIPAAAYQGLLAAWMAIHGFVCLELYGHLDGLPESGRDALFRAQVRLAALAMGLPFRRP
jgi:AcrR family transcriptional regulator